MLPLPIRVLIILVLIHQSKLNYFMELLRKVQTETLISLHITVLPAAVTSFFASHISVKFCSLYTLRHFRRSNFKYWKECVFVCVCATVILQMEVLTWVPYL